MSSPSSELLKHKIVRAGAGAGKTHGLTEHVLNSAAKFIKYHEKMPRVLVTTFTVKATQELKERLLLKASQREDADLVSFVSSSSSLFLSTIHGVFGQFLRKYGHSIGLDSSFEVLSQIEERKIGMNCLKDIVFSEERYQRLLQFYGVGSLYDYVESYYKSSFEHAELKPQTEKELWEDFKFYVEGVKERAGSLSRELVLESGNLSTKTKREEKWLELSSILKEIADFSEGEEAWIYLCAQKIDAFGSFPSNPEKKPLFDLELSSRLKNFWGDLKEEILKENRSPANLKIFAQNNLLFFDLAQKVSEKIQIYKKSQAKIGMSDMELMAFQLAQDFPHAAESFASEWDYWLIDEFQDTSPFQLQVLRKLIGESPYFVVGDPQQSIYYFRGADNTLFQKEEERFSQRNYEKDLLMKNYRTQPECMAFINDFMDGYGFERMLEREEYFDSNYLAAKFLIAPDKETEADAVVSEVSHLLAAGVPAGEICILGRTNRVLSSISRRMNKRKLPNYLHSSGSFYEKREVLDLLACLQFLLNPYDNKNLIQLLRSPWFYVSDAEMFFLKPNEASYWEQLKDKDFAEAIRYLDSLLQFSSEYGVLCALEKALEERGILEFSRVYDPSGKREANIWKLIYQLREKEHHAFFNPLDLIYLAARMAESSQEGETEAAAALEPNRVQLMTIHASKGLEFPYVFVVSMSRAPQVSKTMHFYCNSQGEFSISCPLGEEAKKCLPLGAEEGLRKIREKEKEESLRLLYVAMTRAEKRLYCSWNQKIEKASWVESLSWNLTPGEHRTEKYKYEVEEFASLSESESSMSNAWKEEEIKVREPFLGKESSLYKPLETESVSSLLEQRSEFGKQSKKSEEQEFLGANKYFQKMQKATDGSHLHEVLEAMVRYPGRDRAFYENVLHEKLSGEKFQSSIDFLLKLEEPPFLEILSNCRAEWGFVMKEKDLVIEGQVDLWGRDSQGTLWVLDYKTGSSRYKDKAKEQLNIYAKALQKAQGDKKIRCASIYLEEMRCFSWDFEA